MAAFGQQPWALDAAQRERIEAIEEAARLAWPALHVQPLDGWWLRAEQGITGRANSVWAVRAAGTQPLAARIDAAESFYEGHGLAPRFQITPAAAPELLEELEQRGYQAGSHTWVQTAPLETILLQTPGLKTTSHLEIEVAETFDDVWFALYREAEAATGLAADVREAILRRIEGPVAFAAVQAQGEPAAVGLGVVGGPWLGIFCMSTRPAARRQGAATAILRTLAIWGSLYNAREAYLQVKQENEAALATYARAGFRIEYPYYYCVRG